MLRQNPQLSSNATANLKYIFTVPKVDVPVDPWDEIFSLMEQPLLFLPSEGMNVAYGH